MQACSARAQATPPAPAPHAGYYGISQSASFSEDSPAGGDYLAEICREWEAAAKVRAPWGGQAAAAVHSTCAVFIVPLALLGPPQEAETKSGTRTVVLRIGIVLAADGGALGKMMPVFQIFAGGPLGEARARTHMHC